MRLRLGRIAACFTVTTLAATASLAPAATPSAEQALKLKPVQNDVDYDQPSAADVERCTIKAEKVDGHTGWVVRDSEGQYLRRFVDTNDDNVVDLWSYYQSGIEVYRDVDSDFNGKADQCRWLHLAGTRWGVDKNEDGKIDEWKLISAEEVTLEIVAAIAARDADRFSRLLLTPQELQSLGVGTNQQQQLSDQLRSAAKDFRTLAGKQNAVSNKTRWVDFGATRPGVVPAGTDGSKRDLVVYENVLAMVETDGQHGQVEIGTLVRVGNVWRAIAAPQVLTGADDRLSGDGFFFKTALASRVANSANNTPTGNDKFQKLLDELEKLDESADPSASAAQLTSQNAQRADLLKQLAAAAGSEEDRQQWLRQLADTVSIAVQAGQFEGGMARLETLSAELKRDKADEDLQGYVEFRVLSAGYGKSLRQPNADFVKIQEKWLEDLEKFVKSYPRTGDTAEAMLQLAMGNEFAGEETKATSWYRRIAKDFPDTLAAEKAQGSVVRLTSVGKPIRLAGTALDGSKVDVSSYRGKTLLVHYWATWCEPCKVDLAKLKELHAKHGRSGFALVGISLDSSKTDVDAYLKQNRLPWKQLYEPGGLDSPLANQLGVMTLPTMLLIDDKGNVVNRNIHITELENELTKRLR